MNLAILNRFSCYMALKQQVFLITSFRVVHSLYALSSLGTYSSDQEPPSLGRQ